MRVAGSKLLMCVVDEEHSQYVYAYDVAKKNNKNLKDYSLLEGSINLVISEVFLLLIMPACEHCLSSGYYSITLAALEHIGESFEYS